MSTHRNFYAGLSAFNCPLFKRSNGTWKVLYRAYIQVSLQVHYNDQVTFLKFIVTFTIAIVHVASVESGISPLAQPTYIISPTFERLKLILFESDALFYIYRT